MHLHSATSTKRVRELLCEDSAAKKGPPVLVVILVFDSIRCKECAVCGLGEMGA